MIKPGKNLLQLKNDYAAMNIIFKDAQSVPEFVSKKFAGLE